MKAYIISIAAAAVISAVITIITPSGWSKYVGTVTGFVVAVCIGQPILKLMRTDIFEDFSYETEVNRQSGYDELRDEVREELAKQIEDDAKMRLQSEFGAECGVDAVISADSDGLITGVESMAIYGEGIDNAAIGRLRDIYGVKEVSYDGNQKIDSQQE